ncbi:MAG: IS110 family transposase [Pseudomonadota bacterium]|nr:IS110 family transposase [Pseudomonadota bacterium]
MGEFIRFAVDTAKSVFQVHGEDAGRSQVLQKRLRRAQFLAFFARQASCVVVLEACGSAHHWGRELSKLGHEVRLIPPQHVKPYLKRNKNDMRDAEAIFEASLRPGTHFVPIKTVAQQCDRALHRGRDLLTRQRTQLGNAIRSMLSEAGIIAPQGAAGSAKLYAMIEAGDEAIAPQLLVILRRLLDQWRALHAAVEAMGDQIEAAARTDPRARALMQIPGVGPITAHAVIAAIGGGTQFGCARDFAAWVGLTPRQHSSAEKIRLGHVSKAGDKSLRRLLVLGASAWLRHARHSPDKASPWLNGLLARRPVKVAVVAQAAKTARIIWAMLTSGEPYRAPAKA